MDRVSVSDVVMDDTSKELAETAQVGESTSGTPKPPAFPAFFSTRSELPAAARLLFVLGASALALSACCQTAPRAPSPIEALAPTTETSMNGATSPSGEPHPGEILHEDRVDGRTWTVLAKDVPPTIAWVEVGGRWVPVLRIEITGTPALRRITKFGPDGAFLETTTPLRPPPTPEPEPLPVPTPE